MAHTKSAGSTKYGRDSQPKYLGVKKYAGEKVKTGDIIIRQHGSTFYAGEGVRQGKDYTLFSLQDGFVAFSVKQKSHFDGHKKHITVVSVGATR